MRLSQESGAKPQSFIEGPSSCVALPPSQERVEKNKVHAETLGRGGELGDGKLAARVKPLLDMKPGLRQARQGDRRCPQERLRAGFSARGEAAAALPKEGRFQQTRWERLRARGEGREEGHRVLREGEMQLDPDYFGSYLIAGVAQYRAGNKAKAEELLTQSSKLLPTAPVKALIARVSLSGFSSRTFPLQQHCLPE